jgi:hypothetical protein
MKFASDMTSFLTASSPIVNKRRSGTPGLREGQSIDLVRELGGQPGSQSAPIRTPPRTNFLMLHQGIAVI